jgi:hypothetical protein
MATPLLALRRLAAFINIATPVIFGQNKGTKMKRGTSRTHLGQRWRQGGLGVGADVVKAELGVLQSLAAVRASLIWVESSKGGSRPSLPCRSARQPLVGYFHASGSEGHAGGWTRAWQDPNRGWDNCDVLELEKGNTEKAMGLYRDWTSAFRQRIPLKS